MRLAVLALLCTVLATPAAAARRCGDDVDGRPVPCDCGDVLVGSHTLDARDPIIRRACPGTGLLVDVPAGRPAPTLDLGGQTLSGTGRGVGIHVVSGGDGGLVLVGPGIVRGFDLGVLAGGGQLAAADLVVTENAADGLTVAGTGFALTNCEASRNGRHGFALRGRGLVVEGNRALDNGRSGFHVMGQDALLGGVRGNEAAGNGRHGLQLLGRGHAVEGAVARGNGGAGVRARVSGGRLAGIAAHANQGRGVHAAGRDLTVAGNQASDNGAAGIDVRGARVRDGGDNRASGNGGPAGKARGECRVGASCR
jgi:hypothetical protein